MKNINSNKVILCLLATSWMLFSGFSYTNGIATENEDNYSMSHSLNEEYIAQLCFDNIDNLSMMRDCIVNIKTDDMDIELTLHDVSRWKCFKMKVRAVWTRITGDL